eukprot:CAMPEP_0197029494 /NCGR_PEP_ID=MMETSP1384-20130603/8928_1 /TAXON_ID=29189 /ORGANISM="Ammonia sp." /LENGTH=399 /DNA_ID=CAMNT_0042458671 /DNA_START=17 /DNA_END=1216 /DNA_ORIENTATION=-
MALLNHAVATSVATTETPSSTFPNSSSISTTNSTSLYSSPISVTNKHANHQHVTTFGPMSPLHHIEAAYSQKDIVMQLRQLAQDPHQQIHLINNTDSLKLLCETLLIDSNSRSSIDIAILSLHTLQLLAVNPNYRDTLKAVPHLLPYLDSLCLSTNQRIQMVAKQLKETLNSKIPFNKFQQYQPRPLHKIEFTIINLNNEKDRDEIQTIGIKIPGVISVTVNMSTRLVTFYTTRDNVQKALAQSLRTNGFQVQTDEEKDFDDVCSTYSGYSNVIDKSKDRAQLSSLLYDRNNKNIPYRTPSGSIIPERHQHPHANNSNNNNITGDIEINVSSSNNDNGPSYPDPHGPSRNMNGITQYRPQQHVQSIAERLRQEQEEKQKDEAQQKQTQTFLNKVISYIW